MRNLIAATCGALAFLLCASSGFAQTNQYGSWITGQTADGSGLYAASVNESGHLLGQYCYPALESCLYVLGLSTGCNKGNTYTALVNSDAGAQKLDIVCDGRLDSGKYRYLITPFDDIDTVVKKANRMGFAIALRGDEFLVIRFNLNGSNEAIAAMRARAEERTTVPARRGTRDQRL